MFDLTIRGTKDRPSVQIIFETSLFSEQIFTGSDTCVRSTNVGNKSTNSTKLFTVTDNLENPGTWIISGTLVASSKLLYFDNSPCSPLDQP